MSSMSNKLYVKSAILFLIILDVFLVVYSCQSRSKSDMYDNPLMPDSPEIADSLDNAPIYITSESNGDISTGIGAMGTYFASIDTGNLTGELTPLRKSEAIGDAYLVDITSYLSGSPCGDCFKIDSIALNNVSEVEVSFSMRHPFDMPVNNPPALNERVDLHVFDAQAIFFFKDSGNSVSFPEVSSQVLSSIGFPETMESDNSGFWASQNWDGATNHFDDYVDAFWATASTLHPYLNFFEDSSRGNVNPDSPNGFTNVFIPSGHNVFPQGGGPDQRTLNLGSNPEPEMQFIVLLSAAYGHSAKFKGTELGQRGNPIYMLPEYNRKEPWKVTWNIPSLTDELVSGDNQSSTILNVEVYDWQHDYGQVINGFDPFVDPRDSMSYSSDVLAVYTEIPGVSSMDTMSKAISGTGWGNDPLIYPVTIQNDLAASKGNYLGIIAVTDELHGTNLTGYGIERDGITSFNMKKFVTYALFNVNVIDRGGESLEVGYSLYDPDDPSGYDSGSAVNFNSSAGEDIAVHDNYVHILSSVMDGPAGSGWDVYYHRSSDRGMTFEPPRIVNRNTNDEKIGHQLESTIAVSPDTGDIHMVFTDKAFDDFGITIDQVFYRGSKDNGFSFTDIAKLICTNTSRVNNQPVIATGNSGLVWIAYRSYETGMQNSTSRIVISRSTNYGDIFDDVYTTTALPLNCQTPLAVAHKGTDSTLGIAAFIWRQSSLSAPDIKFVATYDSGVTFSPEVGISEDIEYEYASLPRATMSETGDIFCVYRVNNYTEDPAKLVVTRGDFIIGANIHYWTGRTLVSAPDFLFGDLDIFQLRNDNIYVCWNQLNNVDSFEGQDVYVYFSADGVTFTQYAHINEPTTFYADQDMPRICATANGELFLAYRDNTYDPGGQIFLAHAYE